MNAHILSRGLVLVDLPGTFHSLHTCSLFLTELAQTGLRDLNSARRNITERSLIDCNEIFAVCPIGRAITDIGVKEVFALAKQAGLSNVGIICTRSDVCERLYLINSFPFKKFG